MIFLTGTTYLKLPNLFRQKNLSTSPLDKFNTVLMLDKGHKKSATAHWIRYDFYIIELEGFYSLLNKVSLKKG